MTDTNTLSKETADMLESFYKKELFAANFYTYITNFCRSKAYDCAKKYFHEGVEEEDRHASIIAEYWNIRQKEDLDVPEIPKPEIECEKFEDIIKYPLQLETELLDDYEKEIGLCYKRLDIRTALFLTQFLSIQEQSIKELKEKMRIFEACGEEENYIEVDKLVFCSNEEIDVKPKL